MGNDVRLDIYDSSGTPVGIDGKDDQ